MARTAKKTKAVTVATAENAATDAEIRSVGDVAAEVVAALPAPEPETVMMAEAETVADAVSVAAEPANAPEPEPATGTEIFIPLNKLKKSPRNARKTPHSEADIEAYAASIAAKGILQNLVVETDNADAKEFADQCKDDRHHFRFIVSPEDATDMEDLKRFTRELMAQAEKDLGTKLEWVGVDHWNTDNPHVHVIVRGRTDDGQDLVIDRDYIKSGLRDRAQDLVTLELGPRTELDIRRSLERQIEADRWTQLDRQLLRDANEQGIIDIAPSPGKQPDEYSIQKVGRLRHLEHLGLAESVGPGQWIVSGEAEATLRELGLRGDIIKRMHRALTEQGIERGAADYVLSGEAHGEPVIGRLVERGLDDELRGTAFAVVDGVDGHTHHIRLPDIEAAGDSAPGSIVELRSFEDAGGERRVALAVRSDLSLEAQATADGATWLDRQLVARDPVDLGGGFGLEVSQAMEARTEHLIQERLARRDGERVIFARNLLGTLRERELDALGEKLSHEMNMPFREAAAGEYVAGTYSRRFTLASGRFAMVDDGLGFSLVPWTPSVEKHIGQHISGVARADGGVEWSFGRKRGLGL